MTLRKLKIGLSLLSLVFLSGCLSQMMSPAPDDPRFAPSLPEMKPQSSYKNGSIYQANLSRNYFQDRVARNIGDVLTIRLEETTNAQKKADTKDSKIATTTISPPTIFGHIMPQMDFSTSSNKIFDGKGESKQSNNLQGTISVTVANVLPNGNLVVQGESWININRGQEFVRLTGIVRQDDVDPNNSVSSQKVANARIAYSGTGQVANSNRAGLLTRFFNAYSPY